MRSFCSALNMPISFRGTTLYEVHEQLKVAGKSCKNEAAGYAAGRNSAQFRVNRLAVWPTLCPYDGDRRSDAGLSAVAPPSLLPHGSPPHMCDIRDQRNAAPMAACGRAG